VRIVAQGRLDALDEVLLTQHDAYTLPSSSFLTALMPFPPRRARISPLTGNAAAHTLVRSPAANGALRRTIAMRCVSSLWYGGSGGHEVLY
jgi:hypothetical protein